MFAAVANGVSIDVEGTKSAGDKITDHIAEKGLSDWLAIVRRHHEGTYQHCLFFLALQLNPAEMLVTNALKFPSSYLHHLHHLYGIRQ